MAVPDDSSKTSMNETLIEQYKLYVQMADNVSKRRQDANKFYISLMSALIPVLILVLDQTKKTIINPNAILLIVSFMGILISLIWWLNINSYRQLNGGKFQVINELETRLPYQGFTREWDFLQEGKKSKVYLELTKVERWVPYIFSLPYWALFIYAIVGLLA